MWQDPQIWVSAEAQLGPRMLLAAPQRPLGWWAWIRFHLRLYLNLYLNLHPNLLGRRVTAFVRRLLRA